MCPKGTSSWPAMMTGGCPIERRARNIERRSSIVAQGWLSQVMLTAWPTGRRRMRTGSRSSPEAASVGLASGSLARRLFSGRTNDEVHMKKISSRNTTSIMEAMLSWGRFSVCF